MSYNISCYMIRNGDKEKLKVFSAFRNHQSDKSYIIVDTGKTNDNGDILAYAFIFNPDILEQSPELIVDGNDKDIVINYLSNEILLKPELSKICMSEKIFKISNLLFVPDEGDVFLIVSIPFDDSSDDSLQFVENEPNSNTQHLARQFKTHTGINDITGIIKIIDNKIEQLEHEEQLTLNEKISSGNLDVIIQKVDALFELEKLYEWAIDEIRMLKEIIKIDQERFSNEKYEIDVLGMLAESIAENPGIITESIKSAMILLCKHGCTNRRLAQVLKFVPQKDIASYNNLLYELIIMFPKYFDYKLTRRTANYFYGNDDFFRALELFRVVIDISPEKDIKLQAQLNNDIGCCLIELQNVNGAIEAFKKATEYDDQFSIAYNNWAYILAVECDTIPKNEIWEKN